MSNCEQLSATAFILLFTRLLPLNHEDSVLSFGFTRGALNLLVTTSPYTSATQVSDGPSSDTGYADQSSNTSQYVSAQNQTPAGRGNHTELSCAAEGTLDQDCLRRTASLCEEPGSEFIYDYSYDLSGATVEDHGANRLLEYCVSQDDEIKACG